jgi:hypothetical protein
MRRLPIVLVGLGVLAAAAWASDDSRFQFPAAGVDEPRSGFIVPDYLPPAKPVRFAFRGRRYEARAVSVERTPITPGALPSAREGNTEILTRLEVRAPGQRSPVKYPYIEAVTFLAHHGPDYYGCTGEVCSQGYLFSGNEIEGHLSYHKPMIPAGGRVIGDFVSEVPESVARRDVEVHLQGSLSGLRDPSPANRLTRPG